MLFDSYLFGFFLFAVFILFQCFKGKILKNIFLLLASYAFYACWHPTYILLILLSTSIDYVLALRQDKTKEAFSKKLLFSLSLILNLVILFTFKYNNFFFESIGSLLPDTFSGRFLHDWLLPVGISFYTFQSIAYSYDVYRKNIPAEKNIVNFALYIAFFPQLVAGPIERAKNLLPQIKSKYTFNYDETSYGLKLILLGLIKKVVFANNIAVYVDLAYKAPEANPGLPLILATFLFAFQIYFDFSGYTDIARGSARLFGIRLMENFKGPYLSSSIREFWRRWHISLSTWFRDYLYIPLGGSKRSNARTYLNLLLVFFVTGLWHGANVTFLIWAGIHGAAIIIERLNSQYTHIRLPRYIAVLFTFVLISFTWIFFRASDIDHANSIIRNMTYLSVDQISTLNLYPTIEGYLDLLLVLSFVLLGIVLHLKEYRTNLVDYLNSLSKTKRIVIVVFAIQFFILFGKFYENSQFIYFQF